ncbi:MAG: thioredoxin-disulfide reductase [Oliverpabstia sp.]|nr:thioredoxin-disulfide reductase [Lachnospiraceae bacterium]MDY5024942.1 thioredoxin-disulfide reductase [Oliverpabstia sp.]
METIYDMIIIGSGPAGLTAGIYGKRAGLSILVMEGSFIQGGQIVNTYEVDNYPGLPGISGMDLAEKMKDHLLAQGGKIVRGKIRSISLEGEIKIVHTKKEEYRAKTVVLAAGAVHRKLEVPGEDEFSGMGVSYCATCDGAFFKDKTVAVVGGGDVAVEDAIFLSRTCKKVYLIHRRDELRAAKVLQDALRNISNIELCWNRCVTEIGGSNQVEWIQTETTDTKQTERINVNGIFIAVGIIPDTGFIKDLIHLDTKGYVVAGENGQTNIPGIYAAGDIRTKQLRQIITAAADGANCVASAEKYLQNFSL